MANIALTYRCNLRCPYCFANEFVGERGDVMTLSAFDEALEFVTRTGPALLGIIGGEPTLHPDFNAILERLISDPGVSGATIYTNGVLLDRSFDLLENPKLSLLVNWNPSETTGRAAFDATMRNMDELVLRRGMRNRINLGLNVHGEDMDYGYMLSLLERYGFDKLRLSLTVPDFSDGLERDAIGYFQSKKAFLMRMFRDMDSIGVLPYYDCNRPPYCIWDDEEKHWLEDYVKRHGSRDSSLVNTKSFCRPVVDILPNLEAIRCFGLSHLERVSIRDFRDCDSLLAHFMRQIDRPSFRQFAKPECENCHLRRQWLCTQGCIGFKASRIREP